MTSSCAPRFGRVKLNRCPSDLKLSGSSGVTISGQFAADSVDQAMFIRQNLLSLADNPDEPVVPVVLCHQPELTGFWRITGVSVDAIRDRSYYESGPNTSGLHNYSITAQRIRTAGATRGVIDVAMTAPIRPLQPAGMTAPGYAILPFLWLSTDAYYVGLSSQTIYPVLSEDGPIQRQQVKLVGSTWGSSALFSIAAGRYYDGAARIEVLVAGRWEVLTGRSAPDAMRLGMVRLSNGVQRFTVDKNITVEVFDGSRWVKVGQVHLPYGFANYVDADQRAAVAVLRNSPTRVALSGPSCTLSLDSGNSPLTAVTSFNYIAASMWPATPSTATTGGCFSTAKVAGKYQLVLASSRTGPNEVAVADGAIGFWNVSNAGTGYEYPILIGVAGVTPLPIAPPGITANPTPQTPAQLVSEWWIARTTQIAVIEQ